MTAHGEIDAERTRELLSIARPLSVTFHRAFDMTRDPVQALEALVDLGVDRVLTSGQEATVLEGLSLLTKLFGLARDGIVVMPGGGISSRNIGRIVDVLNPKEVHFAAPQSVLSPMRFRRPHVFMGGELRAPEYDRLDTSLDSVRAVIAEAGSKER